MSIHLATPLGGLDLHAARALILLGCLLFAPKLALIHRDVLAGKPAARLEAASLRGLDFRRWHRV